MIEFMYKGHKVSVDQHGYFVIDGNSDAGARQTSHVAAVIDAMVVKEHQLEQAKAARASLTKPTAPEITTRYWAWDKSKRRLREVRVTSFKRASADVSS